MMQMVLTWIMVHIALLNVYAIWSCHFLKSFAWAFSILTVRVKLTSLYLWFLKLICCVTIMYTTYCHMYSIEDLDTEKAGVGRDSREASTCSAQRTSDQVRSLFFLKLTFLAFAVKKMGVTRQPWVELGSGLVRSMKNVGTSHSGINPNAA